MKIRQERNTGKKRGKVRARHGGRGLSGSGEKDK